MKLTYNQFKSISGLVPSLGDMSAEEKKSIKKVRKIGRHVDEDGDAFDVFHNLTPARPFLEVFTVFYGNPALPAIDGLALKLKRSVKNLAADCWEAPPSWVTEEIEKA